MAEYTYTTEISRRMVFRLPTPSNGAELEKALVAAVEFVKESGKQVWDDSITVESIDGQVLLIITAMPWQRES